MLSSFIHLQYCYDYLVNQISIGLLLYSHIPAAIAALMFGIFLIFQSRKRANVTFFMVCLCFATWCFLDLGSWFAFLGSDSMMFTWSLADLFAPLFYFFSYYFLYTFLTEQDLPTWQKSVGMGLIIPIAVWILMGQKLMLYDANTCEALENTGFNYYQFCIEGVFLISCLVLAMVLYRRAKDAVQKRKVIFATIGVFAFLGFFLSGTLGVNFLVSDSAVAFAYNFEIYGLFGMPILLVYLGYLIVKYHAFDLKIFSAQALSFALVALIGAEFVFVSSVPSIVLVAVTLVLTGAIGILLSRSVKREIEQRERIEKLADELEATNDRQEGLIHFIGHEVKGFLTKDAGAFASLADGDYASLPQSLKPFVEQALIESRAGADSVASILKASNLKKGTVAYTKELFDLKELVRATLEKEKVSADHKGLTLLFNAEDSSYQMNGDKGQIADHVLRNLIDNSINYTTSGSVTVSLRREGAKILFSVKDTGVGITSEDKVRLFTEGGHGKDSQVVNAHSTGYGLYIAKQITEAHGGTIRAESEGAGKGSEFIVEFPAS
ncbi:MAG: Two-component system, NarL family, sensor histidine kinase BarA [Parcubacteria group bacterium]|nr:Two-component system, NarL family, sensor histidine kinase BarA [Parcubacteria group bacterium]